MIIKYDKIDSIEIKIQNITYMTAKQIEYLDDLCYIQTSIGGREWDA